MDQAAFIEQLVEELTQRNRVSLRDALRTAYSHGRADALAPIAAAMALSDVEPKPAKASEQRPTRVAAKHSVATDVKVPRGLPDKFVERVMAEIAPNGISPSLIIPRYAKTPEERAISYSALRKALKRGRELGKYENKRGKWQNA